MKKFKEKNSGITLIALIITIIILIILAGITIGLLLNDDGIAGRAISTKTETEIGEEKEIVSLSSMDVISKESIEDRERLNKDEVERIVEKNARGLNFEITEDDDGYIVEFTQKKRYYKIYDNGQTEQVELVKDKTPGDITKDKDGNTLNGTTNPYEIWSIEDLVAFSNMAGGSGYIFKNGVLTQVTSANNFQGKTVTLKTNLDFKSNISYANHRRTDFGNLNGNSEDGNELKTEMQTGTGFPKIYKFNGTFDGENHTIKNIFQNVTYWTALFKDGSNTIMNLNVTGEITSSGGSAAGISADGKSRVINCKNYAKITGQQFAAGIVDRGYKDIDNCVNYGEVELTGGSYSYRGAGGICGYTNDNITIKNCINEESAVIKGSEAGGIIGVSHSITINNCVNKGIAKGGIVSWQRHGTINIVNCCNLGQCDGGIVRRIAGTSTSVNLTLNIKNSYNLGTTTGGGALLKSGGTGTSFTTNLENFYNAGTTPKAIIGSIDTKSTINLVNAYYDTEKSTSVGITSDGITGKSTSEIKSQSFVNILNSNIGENTDWIRWKLGSDGYPTFDIE